MKLRPYLSFTLMLTAVIFAIISTSYFMQGDENSANASGLAFMGLTIAAAFASQYFAAPFPTPTPVYAPQPEPNLTRWHILSALIGLGFLAFVAEVNANEFHIPALTHVTYNTQFVLWVVGIILMTVGVGGARWQTDWLARHWRECAFVAALTVGALVLRAHNLAAIQSFVDELNFSTAVDDFWLDERVKILRPFSSVASFTYIFPYLQNQTVGVLGQTFEGLRLPSAFFGALTVPALYLLARHLFDRRTAAAAAVLLTTLPVHLQLSRVGLNNIADPLFGVLALGFLTRGLRHNSRLDFALAGAALGLTQYFYEVGRLLFPALVVLWLVLNLRRWQTVWPQLMAFAVVAAAIAAPVYYTWITTDRPLIPRLSEAGPPEGYWSIEAISALPELFIQRAENYLLHFLSRPEGVLYYGRGAPFLHPALLPSLMIGLGVALARWRRSGLILVWVGVTVLASVLLANHTAATRVMVIIPALAALAGLGLTVSLQTLLGDRLRRWSAVVLAGIVMVIGWAQADYYFNQHVPDFNSQTAESLAGQEAVFMARNFTKNLPEGTEIHIIDDQRLRGPEAEPMLYFFTGQATTVRTVRPDELTPRYFRQLTPNVGHVFFISRYDTESIRLARLAARAIGPFDVDLPGYPARRYWFFMAYVRTPG
ncbi:MAG: glycosyltransferase family 39 protein [Anaerolineae bacterium]|nr:glycosyltransferase family 39 protein [Anaerolineae bacterium]